MVLWGVPALAVALLWLPLVRRSSRGAAATPHAPTPWRSATAWWVTAYMALQSLIFYVLLAWLATLTSDRSGLDATGAGVVLSVMQVAGVVGSLVVPVLAGRSTTRTRWVALGATGFSVVGLALLLTAPGSAPVAIVVAGLGMGGSVVLALAAVSSRAADGPGAVALSGMAQAVGYLAAAVGPVVIGGLHTVSGGWTVPLTVLLACAVAQLPASWAANRDRTVTA
jgi:MFS transporter, CP family, cyanate transporter